MTLGQYCLQTPILINIEQTALRTMASKHQSCSFSKLTISLCFISQALFQMKLSFTSINAYHVQQTKREGLSEYGIKKW